MRIAFATCSALPNGIPDDRETAALLGAEFRVWDDPDVDWDAFDRVVVRSTWDYTPRRKEFVDWAHRIGPARLRNVPSLIEANSDKRYLAELHAPTVPTTYVAPGDRVPVLDGEVVVKPTVSAGARDTGRFGPAHHAEARALVDSINASGRTAMVQPYLARVDDAGETALVFLGGELSHVLHKKPVLRPDEVAPRADDERGAAVAMYDPELVTLGAADDAQVAVATRVVADLAATDGSAPVYVRVDLVPDPDGAPMVIEVEAVEPRLYLDLVPGAAGRFAAAVRAS